VGAAHVPTLHHGDGTNSLVEFNLIKGSQEISSVLLIDGGFARGWKWHTKKAMLSLVIAGLGTFHDF